jgi:hypothetical protein
MPATMQQAAARISFCRSTHRRIKLRLEPLEDRWLPSVVTVTSTADSGTGSLRAALAAAQNDDTIDFALPTPSTIHLTSASLAVATGVSIIGPGPSALTIAGNGQVADFLVQASSTISGLTISGGGGSTGGGIINEADLTLNNCVVTNNTVSLEGGGIENGGTLCITGCTISNNTIHGVGTATAEGAGLYNGGTLTLINSSVASNYAYGAEEINTTIDGDSSGGGLYEDPNGAFSIMNCTFDFDGAQGGNTSVPSVLGGNATGGGIDIAGGTGSLTNCTFNNDVALGGSSTRYIGGSSLGGAISISPAFTATETLVNCTIDENFSEQGSGYNGGATSVGGGIGINNNATTTLENTIVAGDTAVTGPDISGNPTTAFYDFIGNGSGTNIQGGGSTGNQVGIPGSPIDPHLGFLQNNGGPTLTMLPLPGSPVINLGNIVFVQTTIDQRGLPRIVRGAVDIGAVEVQAPSASTSYIVADFAGTGIWISKNNGPYQNVLPFDAQHVAVDNLGEVFATFGSNGTWYTTSDQNHWKKLDTRTASWIGVDGGGDLLADFTGSGLYWFYDTTLATTGASARLTPADANIISMDHTTGDFVADFTGAGVWRCEPYLLPGNPWQHLTINGTARDASLVRIDGNNDVFADFPGMGLWKYTDSSNWQNLNATDAAFISISENGNLVAQLNGQGVWRYVQGSWQQLSPGTASLLAIDSYGNVAAEFKGHGLWLYGTSWNEITPVDAGAIQFDINGNLFADLTGFGTWLYNGIGGWTHLGSQDASVYALNS